MVISERRNIWIAVYNAAAKLVLVDDAEQQRFPTVNNLHSRSANECRAAAGPALSVDPVRNPWTNSCGAEMHGDNWRLTVLVGAPPFFYVMKFMR